MIKFLSEHIIELLISAIVALLAIVGQYQLTEIRTFGCKVALTAAELKYDQVSFDLMSITSLDDLQIDSKPIKDTGLMRSRFGPQLTLCEEGRDLQKQYEGLNTGLLKYVSRDYDAAIASFSTLSGERSLTHRLLGASWDHKAASLRHSQDGNSTGNGLNNSAIDEAESKANQEYIFAKEQAKKETQATTTAVILQNLTCSSYMVLSGTDNAKKAQDCFKDIVKNGRQDYNTYYNLACMASRLGDFPQALLNFQASLNSGAKYKIRRSEAENDSEFKDYILKSQYAGQFRALLDQLPTSL